MTILRAINAGEMAARPISCVMSAEMLATIGDVKSDFPTQFWTAGDYKGQQSYTIPLDAQALVLYYNKDMFKAAGLPMPSSIRR